MWLQKRMQAGTINWLFFYLALILNYYQIIFLKIVDMSLQIFSIFSMSKCTVLLRSHVFPLEWSSKSLLVWLNMLNGIGSWKGRFGQVGLGVGGRGVFPWLSTKQFSGWEFFNLIEILDIPRNYKTVETPWLNKNTTMMRNGIGKIPNWARSSRPLRRNLSHG